jgi:hypothetical protein
VAKVLFLNVGLNDLATPVSFTRERSVIAMALVVVDELEQF